MIAWLEGVLRDKAPTRVVLDVQGVGYDLHVPLSTFTALPDEGKTVSLHVHTSVREDAIQLFGFASAAERRAFELLLKASRVGPRMAQGILSGIEARALCRAIRAGDVSALRGIPGVGLKTAERIVVELRDRVGELAERSESEPQAGERAPLGAGGVREEALSALLNLGYPRARAEKVIEEAVSELGGEPGELADLIRAALRSLAA